MIDDVLLSAIGARLAAALAPPRKRYRPFLVGDRTAGWIDDARIALLERMRDVFVTDAQRIALVPELDTDERRSEALERTARELSAGGHLSAWRNERYAISEAFASPPWCRLERAAARFFGVRTFAAHVNGVVSPDGAMRMWLARRSPTKAIDPSMLDNLVGGGMADGQTVADTVVKESSEEAAIDAPLARLAKPAGAVHICREQPDGLQRETIFVHDLHLAPDFTPMARDREVVEYRLVSLPEAARLISLDHGPDVVTADASLVVLDYLIRHGHVDPDAPVYTTLEALRHPYDPFAVPARGKAS